jgi:hypothetical protein
MVQELLSVRYQHLNTVVEQDAVRASCPQLQATRSAEAYVGQRDSHRTRRAAPD